MKKFLARFAEFYRPFLKLFAVVTLFTCGVQFLGLLSPYFYGKIIDALIGGKAYKEVLTLAAMSLGIFLLNNSVVGCFSDLFDSKNVRYDTPKYVAKKTLSQVVKYSLGQHIGQNSGATQDVIKKGEHSMGAITGLVLYYLLPVALQIVLFAGALLYLEWSLGLIVLGGLALHLGANIYLNFKFKDSLQNLEKKRSDVSKFYSEILRNIGVVKVNAQEERVVDEYDEQSQEVCRTEKDLWIKYMWLASWRDNIIGLTIFAVIAVGAFYVHKKLLSVGQLVVFLFWTNRALGSIGQLGNVQRQLMSAAASVKNFFAFLEIEPDIKIMDNPVRPGKFFGEIEFKNVSFSYPKRISIGEEKPEASDTSKRETISGVSFKIKAGQKAAFVGLSGSGKSTIIKLLLRAYDPDEGQVIVDGNDLRIIDHKHFMNSVGVVEQDITLFDNTLRYNITFPLNGRGRFVSFEEMARIAELSRINEFYPILECGFDTIIGERGIKLSGGQRKRVGIARALIKNPSILIFDEATSDLDAMNDAMIQDSIKEIGAGRTMIIIAHRLSTIKDADVIFVVSGGKIVGEGKHHELMKICPEYQILVHKQVKVF
ncbi:MAG: ABC transporter ATP-binding protein/permease [Candidatus Pacebacteria bacterium]|nr:ABC transporter ATP-binding protein/permease [Candidatus Paceibacterota bacterium]